MYSTIDHLRSRKAVRPTAASFLVAACSILLAPVVAHAQVVQAQSPPAAARALSLEEAVRTAEAQSEAIRIARAGVLRSQGQQYQARSQRLPQINGSASYTRTLASQFQGLGGSAPPVDTTKPPTPPPPCDAYLRDPAFTVGERLAGLEDATRCAQGGDPFASFSSLPFGQKNQYSVGLSFSQNLFAGGRITAQNDVANSGRNSAEIELAAQRAQIRLDVTEAYFDAALADRLVALAESSAVQTGNVLRQTQLARNVGNVSEFELLRAQVSSANQRPIVIQRQSDREVAYLRLKQLLNLPLDSPVQLTTAVDDEAAATAALEIAGFIGDTVAQNRATVRQAAEAIDAQRGLLRVAKSQRLPSLSLTSQYGKVAFPQVGLPSSADFRTNWTVGIISQIPIFTGGRIKGEQMVAEANLREAQARYDQVREFAALDSRVTLNALIQARAAWQASQGTAEQAARAYSIAEVRYREGISTQLELSDSRILLEQAVANRALAARNLQVARVKLELLPDLPLQSTGAGQSQLQTQSGGTGQQSPGQQNSQQTQAAQQQAQQQQTGIPPQ
jgi:outer membrane protein TolC